MHSPSRIFPLLICLYFSQGLPSGMLAHALPAIMREYGVSREWIGLIKLLALPWFLKLLWAPYIDQYWQRRNWIMLFQCTTIGILLAMSLLTPELVFGDWLIAFLILILLLNVASASQDIASDGLAIRHIRPAQLGLANSIQVSAYKLGLIGGGTLLLVLLDTMGWQTSLQCFAAVLALALLPVPWLRPDNGSRPGCAGKEAHTPWREVFTGFMQGRNMGLWLCIVATYKMADGLSSAMIKPMLVDYGYSLADIGYLTSASSVAGIIGAVVGGLLFLRLSLHTALLAFGLLQTTGIGLMALVPAAIESTSTVYALALFEQFTDNLSTVALFAAMMMHCRKGLEGSDYTLQNSVFLMGSGTAGAASGFIAEIAGYQALFMGSAALGILSLGLLFLHRPQQVLRQL